MHRTTRRFAFALLALTGAATAATAQQKTILVGPTFGFNSARITGDNQEDNASRTGLRFGGFASIDVGSRLAIQPELLISSKGAKYPDDDAELKIGYVQVPLLARYRFGQALSNIRPYLMAGPAFAFKSGCQLLVEGDDIGCDGNTDVAGSDLSMILGGGVDIGVAQISARLDLGGKNINGDGPANVKNKAFTIAVGYGFRLGR